MCDDIVNEDLIKCQMCLSASACVGPSASTGVGLGVVQVWALGTSAGVGPRC